MNRRSESDKAGSEGAIAQVKGGIEASWIVV